MWRLWSNEAEAVADALKLARGMSYKNAMAGLDHGGGKAVIIGDPDQHKTEELLLASGSLCLGRSHTTRNHVRGVLRETLAEMTPDIDLLACSRCDSPGSRTPSLGAGEHLHVTARGEATCEVFGLNCGLLVRGAGDAALLRGGRVRAGMLV